ncbi:MAG: hypothetical protein HY321_00190 [Armatimonadetes bacterium]|nr:hypothetical protein [Armatimonadota bacterium]
MAPVPRENAGSCRERSPLLPRRAGGRASPADWLALGISALASPFLILPLFAFVITAAYSTDWRHWLCWSTVAAFFSTGIPLLYVLNEWCSGRITDLHVMQREQRGSPFLVALLSSTVGTAVLFYGGAPLALVVVGIGIVCNGIVFALITLRWKISLHPSVYAACVICAAVLAAPGFAWGLLALPAIVWARVRRTRHSLAQGLAAIGVAAAVTLGVLALYGYLRTGPS